MSQWQKLTTLCMKNKALQSELNELYITSSFPYKIRSKFAAWIEETEWHSIDIESEHGRRIVEEKYEELLNQIDATIKNLSSGPDFNFEASLDLSSSRELMKQNFDSNLYKFVTELKRCLTEERSLLICDCPDDPEELKRKPKKFPCYAKEDLEMKHKLSVIDHEITAAENAVFFAEKEQELFSVKYRRLTESITSLEHKMNGATDQQKDELAKEKKLFEEEREKLAFENLQRRNKMADMHIALATNLAYILQSIWSEAKKFNLESRLESVGLAQVKKGTLEILDKLFEQGGYHLYRMMQQVDAALNLYKKVNYTDDKKRKQMEMVLKELTFDYLPMFLQRAFIFEQMTWKERVIRISNGRSNTFNLCARVLGGKALGLNFTKPKVKISLFHEKDIPPGDTYVPGFCEISNGDEKAFVLHHSTNACVVQFLSIQLKNLRKPERVKVEDPSEHKFAFVFYTSINVCNKFFSIKLVSQPFILITHSSQEIYARGSLIWDAAFSEEIRTPFNYRDTVLWSELSNVLNCMFYHATDRQLQNEHLNYLAQIFFRDDKTSDFSLKEISEKQFIKSKLQLRDFSLWKWFVACLNLVVSYVKVEWQNGWIYGFISREEVKKKLLCDNIPCGTFLLRFSETTVENTTKSDLCGQLTMAVLENDPITKKRKLFHVRQYLTQPDLLKNERTGKQRLANILKAFRVADEKNPEVKRPLLQYLWPYMDRTFEQVFGPRNIPKTSEDGYEKTEFVIEIILSSSDSGNQNNMEISETDRGGPAVSPGSFDAMSPGSFLQEVERLNRPVATITPQTQGNESAAFLLGAPTSMETTSEEGFQDLTPTQDFLQSPPSVPLNNHSSLGTFSFMDMPLDSPGSQETQWNNSIENQLASTLDIN